MWEFLKRLFSSHPETIEEDPMKYLIVGLGNVGDRYENTRHNIGFEVVDAIAKSKGKEFTIDNQAYSTTIKHKGRTIILLKPTTYMNLSGKAVRYWMTKQKIQPENLLVIVDDLNLQFGTIRLRKKGKDGGHNGLKSIQDLLQTQNYARLRMGIGNDFSKGSQVNYVLGEWSTEEKGELNSFIVKAMDAALDFTTMPIGAVMSNYNG